MTKENQILIELLDNVSKWSDLKEKLEQFNTSKTETTTKKTFAGKIFEYFCKYYFQTSPEKIDLYKNVWHYEEIPLNVRKKLNLPSIDHGIDILLKDIDNNYHAVQCKFKNDESKNLSWSGDKIANVFALGTNCQKVIVFSNVSDVTKVAKAFGEKYEQILNDTLLELDKNDFKRILALANGNQPPNLEKYTPLKHQKEAIEKVTTHFKTENRGQLILPCGAGKTLTALWIKEQLKAKTTLVLVPSLALLRQIKNDWAKHKNTFYRPLYVCSEKDIDKGVDSTVTHSYEIGGPVTTDYKIVQNFLEKNDEKIIFSTYQSIEVVSEASKQINDFKFDLIICDEAHRTAGSTKKNTFTIVHDNNKLPAVKRLYMTATPKVASASLKTRLGEDYSLLCDMSNPAIYGTEAYRMSFGEAIEKGILVDYKIIGIGVTDKEIKKYIEEREFIGQITAEDLAHNFALDLVMNKYKAFHGLTFHSRVILAQEFAKRHEKYFDKIYAESVNGKQTTTYRKRILDSFKKSTKGIVSNARCLTEGVDVPIIDLIYFCDPKSSKIDIVQASGRALRKDPTGKKKQGLIVVPIFHHIDQDIEKEISNNPIFNYLIQVVRSLCDQDERLEAEINKLSSKKGKRTNSKIEIDFSEEETERIIKLEGLEKKIKDALFDIIIEKNRTPASRWNDNYENLLAYYKEHGNSQPSQYENPELYFWYLRVRKNQSKLSEKQVSQLKDIDFNFTYNHKKRVSWDSNLENLKKYKSEQGHCNVPRGYSDITLANFVSRNRFLLSKGKLSQLKIQKLATIGFDDNSNSKSDVIWNQFYDKLKEFYKIEKHSNVPARYSPDKPLGNWAVAQRVKKRNNHLTISQVELLNKLNFIWIAKIDVIEEFILNLSQFKKKYGHIKASKGSLDFPKLAQRINRYKTIITNGSVESNGSITYKRRTIKKTQVDKLKKLGIEKTKTRWELRLEMLKDFHNKHGHYKVKQSLKGYDGLYHWLFAIKKNGLSQERKNELIKIGFDDFEIKLK